MDVIIPTKNSEKIIGDCLKALKKQTIPVRIVVVDGYSTDKTRDIAKEYGTEILMEPLVKIKGSNRALACNKALKFTTSEFIGFIDSDTIVPPTWAEDFLRHLYSDSRIAAVTSGCVQKGKKNFSFAVSRVVTIGSTHAQTFTKVKEVKSVPGYNAIYLRKAIDEVGGFDETIGGCEDRDLNIRLRKTGWKLLGVPESPVEHRQNHTLKSFAKQMFWYGWSRGRLLKKKHIFTPLHMLPSLALLGLIVLGILFPPLEFTFSKSLFDLYYPPWFEKVVEVYLFFVSLWSFVLIAKVFTLKLWLQTIGAFIIRDVSWAVGWLKGLLD